MWENIDLFFFMDFGGQYFFSLYYAINVETRYFSFNYNWLLCLKIIYKPEIFIFIFIVLVNRTFSKYIKNN